MIGQEPSHAANEPNKQATPNNHTNTKRGPQVPDQSMKKCETGETAHALTTSLQKFYTQKPRLSQHLQHRS